jgi:uncharacterized lipoprotein YajG
LSGGRPRGAGLALLAAALLSGCAAPPDGQVVQVPVYAPGSVASPLSRAARAIVAVAPFAELPATLPGSGGPSTDVDIVARFAVTPSPGRVLRQAVTAELRAAGEQIAAEGAPVTLTGAVQRFTVKASKAGLYWALEVDIGAAVTARRAGLTLSHSYVARCQDVAYTSPGPASMTPLVAGCVANIAGQFRDDVEMARAIGG